MIPVLHQMEPEMGPSEQADFEQDGEDGPIMFKGTYKLSHYPHSNRIWTEFFDPYLVMLLRSKYDLIAKMLHFTHQGNTE